MMNYHKECVGTFVQYVVGQGKVSSIQCQCSPLPSAIFKGALCLVCLDDGIKINVLELVAGVAEVQQVFKLWHVRGIL